MEDIGNIIQEVIDCLIYIYEAMQQIVEFLGQGFVAIQTFLSLPTQATAVTSSLTAFMPGIIWGPVVGIFAIMLVLRVWKIIVSGD